MSRTVARFLVLSAVVLAFCGVAAGAASAGDPDSSCYFGPDTLAEGSGWSDTYTYLDVKVHYEIGYNCTGSQSGQIYVSSVNYYYKETINYNNVQHKFASAEVVDGSTFEWGDTNVNDTCNGACTMSHEFYPDIYMPYNTTSDYAYGYYPSGQAQGYGIAETYYFLRNDLCFGDTC